MKPKFGLLEAKQKIEAFCAYQERCDQEVRKKLKSWNMYSEDVDVLISDLISHNFLNEERFTKAYVSGKFRIKKWGRIKIKQHLKQKAISDYSMRAGLSEIDMNEYLETLEQITLSKSRLMNESDTWKKYAKMQRYLHGKGYEQEFIIQILEKTGLKPA